MSTENLSSNELPVTVKRTNPDELRPIYVNDLTINHTPNEFFITFSQIEIPAILPEQVFTKEEAEKLIQLNAIAITKLVMTPEFTKIMIDALVGNYDKYLENVKSSQKESK